MPSSPTRPTPTARGAARRGAGACGGRPERCAATGRRARAGRRAGGPLAARARRPGQPPQALRPRASSGERVEPSEPGWRRTGCRCSTTSTGRSATRRRGPGADRRGRPGGARPGAGGAGAASASRAATTVGEPFDPARHEAVSVRRRADAPSRARSSAVVRPGYGDARARSCDRPRSWSPAEAGTDGRGARLLRGARRAARRASSDEIQQRLPQAGPAVPPRRQQGPGRRGPLQGDLRGLRRAVRPGDAPALRRASGTNFRQVPEGVDRTARARGSGPGAGSRRADAGSGRLRRSGRR